MATSEWLLGKKVPYLLCDLALIFLENDSYHLVLSSLDIIFLLFQNTSSHEQKLILSKVNQKLKKKEEEEEDKNIKNSYLAGNDYI